MITLDRNIPFVRAVLGGSLSDAAGILKNAEERHGLRWSTSSDMLEECQEDAWYRQHLWPFLSETHFVVSGGDLLTACSLFGADGLDHTPTWRHWGDILAEWANHHWMARPSGLGQTAWSRSARPWEYLDFYMHDYLSYHIAEYDLWWKALHEVLLLHNAAA